MAPIPTPAFMAPIGETAPNNAPALSNAPSAVKSLELNAARPSPRLESIFFTFSPSPN